jgi:Zn-dependent protease with chaperone function
MRANSPGMNTTWSDSSSSWPAIAYQNRLPDGKANGRITMENGQIIFSAGGVPPLRMSLDRLDIRYGGFNNQQAFLSHPDLPEWTFLCADPGFIKDDAIRKHPVHGKLAGRKVRSSKKWPWPAKAMLVMLVLFIAGVTALWMARGPITGWVAGKIPVSMEKQLGEMVFQQVKATSKMVDDPALKAQLDAITARLLPAIKDKHYDFQFHIVENDVINAFAIPGGHIVVHTGLLKKAKRPEEVAGVLAHEIAHITRRHSLRTMVGNLGWMVVIQAMFGDYTALAGSASTLLEQKGSRDFEREADETGWQYLLDANIDPRGMTDFFKILLEEEKKTGLAMDGVLNILSTHPATGERVATLEQKWTAVPADRKFEPLVNPSAPATGPPVP